MTKVLSGCLEFVMQQLRIGSSSLLLLFDFVFLAGHVTIDFVRFSHTNTTLQAAFSKWEQAAQDHGWFAVVVFVVYGFLLPLFVTAIIVNSRLSGGISIGPYIRRKNVFLIHVIFAAMIAAYYLFAVAMQEASGFRWTNDVLRFSFDSIFVAYTGMIAILVPSIGNLIGWVVGGGKDWSIRKRWNVYREKSQLADLDGVFFPRFIHNWLPFNSVAVAPIIRFIDKDYQRIRAHLRRQGAGEQGE